MAHEQRRKTRQERIESMKEHAAVALIITLFLLVFVAGAAFGTAWG